MYLIVPNPTLSVIDGAIVPWGKMSTEGLTGQKARNQALMCSALSRHYKFDITQPWEKLSKEVRALFLHGSKGEKITFQNYDGKVTSKIEQPFTGIIEYLSHLKHEDSNWAKSEYNKYVSEQHCSHCHGSRLRNESLCVKIADMNIFEVSKLKVEDAIVWAKGLCAKLNSKQLQIAEKILCEIIRRLEFYVMLV